METKFCPRCKQISQLNNFHRDKRRSGGISCYCKKCNTELSAKWVKDNRERVREYFIHYNSKNAKTVAAYKKKYAVKNPDVQRNVVRTRRARKRANTLNIPSIEDINKRMITCGGVCVYCDAPFTQVDHVCAIKNGGTDDINNLVPACSSCNFKKATKNWKIWFSRQHFYSQKRADLIESLITAE